MKVTRNRCISIFFNAALGCITVSCGKNISTDNFLDLAWQLMNFLLKELSF